MYKRQLYDQTKSRLLRQHAGDTNWPLHRLDDAARWITIKRFLVDLWAAWCAAEGIHNRGPYGLTTLADGTRVIRLTAPDGSYQDHAFVDYPRWSGNGKI